MLILKTIDGLRLPNKLRQDAAAALAKEAETGVLLLPSWCELVAVTESSAEVKIINSERTEEELAAYLV